jgi:hypothetical protein
MKSNPNRAVKSSPATEGGAPAVRTVRVRTGRKGGADLWADVPVPTGEARALLLRGVGRALAEGGHVIPVAGKAPFWRDWTAPERRVKSVAEAERYLASGKTTGFGLMLGDLFVSLDIDSPDEAARVLFGEGIAPSKLAGHRTWSRAGKARRLWRLPDGADVRMLTLRVPTGTRNAYGTAERRTVLEVRTGHVQDVLAGSTHPETLEPYGGDEPPEAYPLVPLPVLQLLREDRAEAMTRLLGHLGVTGKDAAEVAGEGGDRIGCDSRARMAFNAAHTVEDILEEAGWEEGADGKWGADGVEGNPGLSPVPGTDGLWREFNGNSPLFGLVDAWKAFVVLGYSGDTRKAERSPKAREIEAEALKEVFKPVPGYVPDPLAEEMRRAREAEDDDMLPRGKGGVDGEVSERAAKFLQLAVSGSAIGAVPLPEYLVEQERFPAHQTGVLLGARNVGKSALAVSVATAVASGCECGGWRPVKRQLVLYVAAEGQHGLRRRIFAEVQRLLLNRKITRPEDVALIVLPAPVALLDGGDIGALQEAALILAARDFPDVTEFGLVIFDTLARVFGGDGDESSNKDVTKLLNNAEELRDNLPGQPALLFLAHPGHKEAFRVRGAYAMEGNVDFILVLTQQRKPGEAGAARASAIDQATAEMFGDAVPLGDLRELTCTKMRDDEEPPPIGVRFGTWRAGLDLPPGKSVIVGDALLPLRDTSAPAEGAKVSAELPVGKRGKKVTDTAILGAIGAEPGKSQQHYAAALGMARPSLLQRVERLREKGLVTAEGPWKLTPEGVAQASETVAEEGVGVG